MVYNAEVTRNFLKCTDVHTYVHKISLENFLM